MEWVAEVSDGVGVVSASTGAQSNIRPECLILYCVPCSLPMLTTLNTPPFVFS